MNYIKISKHLVGINMIFFLAYNTYFGWNLTPGTDNESICDVIFIFNWGIIIAVYFRPLAQMYENKARQHVRLKELSKEIFEKMSEKAKEEFINNQNQEK